MSACFHLFGHVQLLAEDLTEHAAVVSFGLKNCPYAFSSLDVNYLLGTDRFSKRRFNCPAFVANAWLFPIVYLGS